MASEMRAPEPALELSYPEPPPGLTAGGRTGLWAALLAFGPGAIIASANIGSGETIFSARGGAIFGYGLLWTLIVCALAKGALVYSTNRYITITGEHPMSRWATLFPGPRGWFPLLLGVVSVLAFPSWISGLSTALGDLLGEVIAGPGQVWATAIILSTGLFAWLGTYDWLERAQTVIIALKLGIVAIGLFFIQPDWLSALAGLLPTLPDPAGWVAGKYPDIAATPVWLEVATYLGAVGGGVYDYIGYTGMLREKGWGMLGHNQIDAVNDRLKAMPGRVRLPLPETPEEVTKARAWTRAPLGDTLISFTAVAVFACMFLIYGTVILGDLQLIPEGNDTLTHQANFFTSIASGLEFVYYLGIFVAFYGAVYALWELYCYTTYETLGAVSERVRRGGVRSVRRYLYPYNLLVALLLVWTIGEVVAIVTPASVIGGVLMCGVICLAMLWTERQVLPPAYRLTTPGRIYVLCAGILLVVLGVISVWELLFGG